MITGVKQLSMADYLASHGVSQSSLKLLARSPAHLKYALEHPEPSTPDQDIGTVFDVAVFEQDRLKDCCYVIPTHYENEKGEKKPWHGGANFCKDWLKKRQDKIRIHQSDFSDVLLMRDAVFNHPAAALALSQGGGATLFCEDADTGLQLRGRPDWMSGNVMLDLKSCQDASEEGFKRTIATFGYHVQAAFYLDMAAVLGLGKEHFVFIAAEKTPPYAVAAWELDEASIADGRSKYRRLLRRYLECVIDDKWPAYSKNIETISLPQYARFAERTAQLLEDQPAQPALTVE